MSIHLLATLDTKGTEAAFVRDRLVELGQRVTVVDTGCIGQPQFSPDVSRGELFHAAGTSLEEMLQQNDRGQAVGSAAQGAVRIVRAALADDRLDGVLSLGGSAGTTIGTTAMRALPVGIPKLMVSTLASGQVRQYVGDKDILMFNSIVDIAGINRISRQILSAAAAAMAGLVEHRQELAVEQDKSLIAASMFGVTTPCVQHARHVLEDAGYEVLVFHATGNGGQAMESLIRDGLVAGVLDITTTELADELVGGILSAGPDRLTAAAQHAIPQVISVGATDMVNFGSAAPNQFAGRRFYQHNPSVTLMRTTPEENTALGKEIAQKAAAASGPTALLLPLKGVSALDKEGQPFNDPQAREVLFAAVRQHRGRLELLEIERHINDVEFAEAAAQRLLQLIQQASQADRPAGDLP